MCSAFRVKNLDAFPNLTIKKIPRTVLTRCEWGRDDYSLEIKNLPAPVAEPEPDSPLPSTGTRAARKARMAQQARTLFDDIE
jgi:adenine-specific DNA-methyltransferase